MGKIVVSENVTLDGVIQDPAGDEGFKHGGWVGLISNSPQLGKLALDEALGAEAFLLGRRSYEWLAARWPSRSGELADRLNSLPKYVVSSTLEDPDWNNSTVLKGDVVNEVLRLKQKVNGDILVYASGRRPSGPPALTTRGSCSRRRSSRRSSRCPARSRTPT